MIKILGIKGIGTKTKRGIVKTQYEVRNTKTEKKSIDQLGTHNTVQ